MQRKKRLAIWVGVLLCEFLILAIGIGVIKSSQENDFINTNIPAFSPEDDFVNELTLNRKWIVPITYSISDECGEYQTFQIESAMNELTDVTQEKVVFEQSSSAQLKIECSFIEDCYQRSTRVENGLTIIYEEICAYEKGLTSINSIDENGNILGAEILFTGLGGFAETGNDGPSGFFVGSCGNYDLASHELLHALGYEHNNNENSIMHPEIASVGFTIQQENACLDVNSDKNIDENIVQNLVQIY